MKTTEQNEIAELFAGFKPDGNGAESTCRLIDNDSDGQEWRECGTIDGNAVEVYWIFYPPFTEDTDDLPFYDVDYVTSIVFADE